MPVKKIRIHEDMEAQMEINLARNVIAMMVVQLWQFLRWQLTRVYRGIAVMRRQKRRWMLLFR